MIRFTLFVGLTLAATAAADPIADRAALTQFETAYQPTATASASGRTSQACSDALKLHDAGKAFSHDSAPADAPVDDVTWNQVAGGLGQSLDDLVKVCQAPDRKLHLLGSKFQTAEDVVKELDDSVHAVLDAAKPRLLPSALVSAQVALRGMSSSPTTICKQQAKLARALSGVIKPPPGVVATTWKDAYGQVKALSAAIGGMTCSKPLSPDEVIGSTLGALHDSFYRLVLLVPPR